MNTVCARVVPDTTQGVCHSDVTPHNKRTLTSLECLGLDSSHTPLCVPTNGTDSLYYHCTPVVTLSPSRCKTK